jgi:hypothetical protein
MVTIYRLENWKRLGGEQKDVLFSYLDASFKGFQVHSSQGNAMLGHKDFPDKATTVENHGNLRASFFPFKSHISLNF